MPKVKKEEDFKTINKECLAKVKSPDDEEDEAVASFDITSIPKKGEQRWKTLSHNGVLFAPPYVPHGIPITYDGKSLKLHPLVEEVATMYASMRNTDYVQKSLFRDNFFYDFKRLLDKYMPGHPVRTLHGCNFDAIYNHVEAERLRKKNLSREEKKLIKQQRDEAEAKFKECLWDGEKQTVGNFRVEPPSLFRGRGKHPKQGFLKARVEAEQITINIGKGEDIPEPPAGHKWGKVIHDQTVTWLACWMCPLTHNYKYVMLSANSRVKSESDIRKFENARALHKIVDNIRNDYRSKWTSSSIVDRQLGVATYFIDKLALRAGNEKGEDEADTVGCCTLRADHVSLKDGNQVYFNFLGKDSVPYENTVKVDPMVYKLVGEFRESAKRNKADDSLFSSINTTSLNDYLHSFSESLTAKVFRTYNASICLQQQLAIDPPDKSVKESEKVAFFNKANKEVAELCNHQKQIGKNHGNAIASIQERIDYCRSLIDLAKKLKTVIKKDPSKAEKDWFKFQDDTQWAWLNEHGTEEQKNSYQERINERGSKKKRSTKSNDDDDPRPKKRAKKEEKDNDDQDLLEKVSKGAKTKSNAKLAKSTKKDAAKKSSKYAAKKNK